MRRPNIIVKSLKENGKIFTEHLDKVKKFHEAYTLPLRRGDEPRRKNKLQPVDKNLEISEESGASTDDQQKGKHAKRRKKYQDKNIEESEDELESGESE